MSSVVNFVFLLLIGCCYGIDVREIEWAIVKTLPIASKVNLECPYTKAVNCRWRRADDEVAIDYRYGYLAGDGQNTTDCSIQIIFVTKKDLNWWTCEIYDPSGANQPVAKLWHVLISGYSRYGVSSQLVMFQPLLDKQIGGVEFLICSATTYVDKCFFMDLTGDRSNWLDHYKNKNVYANTCNWENYVARTDQNYCGLGKEILLPRKLNDDVIELECDDMTNEVECSWRFNQQELKIDGNNIKYRHQSINSKDCSIHVNISNPRKQVQGLYECRMQTNSSSSSILNVYSIQTNPTTEEEFTTALTDVSTFDTNSTTIQNIIFQSDGRVFICLLVLTLVIIIKFILSAILWLNKKLRQEGRQIRHVESEGMINKSSGSL